ncbi:putative glycine dehydrogenase (decarboxylating) subunit 1 [bioreactor metagenome]|uniref:Putative glycine dehydrogenase (Decarboxylating) subunit 1 n=1 Tax=bioreactor metagenome TaxID=1076179 RepID=A0A645D8J5_9ZZZZ
MANLCYQKAHYAAAEIAKLPGFEVVGTAPFFHEFVVKCPRPINQINNVLLDEGILGGYDLSKDFPTLKNYMLVAVTEMNRREEIDALIEALAEVKHD